MVSERILQYKNRIREIEEELRVIQKNMDKLKNAEKGVAKKDRELIEVRNHVMQNVRKACERGTSLRAMKFFSEEMERAVGGYRFEKMYQSIEEVKKGISDEREECVQTQKRLLREKEELQQELEILLQKEVL